ncbi:phenoloxidase-activating factor 2 [Anabrus simplex]|uniref:phenoloxidase-activating factor 2 n=1 Tax=Anabrus simplex TaxID=316456 RepID=UPI0034DD6E38
MSIITLVFCGALLVSYVQAQGQSLDEMLDQFGGSQGSQGQNQQGQSGTGETARDPLDCTCVPYYQCQNGTVIQNGVGLIDIRIKEGPCESYLDVCCQAPIKDPVEPPPPVRNGNCGARHPEGVGFRITGDNDNESQFGEFPWMVAILREETLGDNPEKLNVYKCGGSLIHQQMVLTAAHCVYAAQDGLKIRAGEWDTQTKNEVLPHQDRNVINVFIHPDYHSGALYNDVALLLLDKPVALADNVDVVCLPEQDQVFDHSRCFASGWGKDVFGKEGRYQVILKKVELPVVPRDTCINSLRQTRLGNYFELHESFICAGGEQGKDTCKGDGGSPLVCPSPNDQLRYQQAGIVAWGIGCGENNTPGVYANVAKLRSWIDTQMNANNLGTDSYNIHTRPV